MCRMAGSPPTQQQPSSSTDATYVGWRFHSNQNCSNVGAMRGYGAETGSSITAVSVGHHLHWLGAWFLEGWLTLSREVRNQCCVAGFYAYEAEAV